MADNEIAADYMNNTDILYRKTQHDVGDNYIRHSQIAAGFPVFCAGEFQISDALPFFGELRKVNELVEVNNHSGHYRPKCKCLGVVAEKLQNFGIDMSKTEFQFQGLPENCR